MVTLLSSPSLHHLLPKQDAALDAIMKANVRNTVNRRAGSISRPCIVAILFDQVGGLLFLAGLGPPTKGFTGLTGLGGLCGILKASVSFRLQSQGFHYAALTLKESIPSVQDQSDDFHDLGW